MINSVHKLGVYSRKGYKLSLAPVSRHKFQSPRHFSSRFSSK